MESVETEGTAGEQEQHETDAPGRFVERGLDRNRKAGPIIGAGVIQAGANAKAKVANGKVGEIADATRTYADPIMIEAFQLIREAKLLRGLRAGGAEAEFDLSFAGWNEDGAGQRNWFIADQDGFYERREIGARLDSVMRVD